MDNQTIKQQVESTHERTDAKVTTRTQSFVNEAQREVCRRHNFSFMRAHQAWAQTAPYTTGTVSVTNNSTVVTGTGTSWVGIAALDVFEAGGERYAILGINSNTQLTLARAYEGATASGVPYTIYRRTFVLPTTFKDELQVWISKEDESVELVPLDRTEVLRRFGPEEVGEPVGYIILGTTVEFWPAADAEYLILAEEYDYLADLSANGDTNRITIEAPELLIAGGVERAFRLIGEIQDAAYWKSEFERQFQLLVEKDTARILGGEPVLAPRADVLGTPNTERMRGTTRVGIANNYGGGSNPSN